ncbi:MAG: site-2 protease family protein [Acidimicrobiales bacterium]
MTDGAPWEPGAPRPPRQHAYPTAVTPPRTETPPRPQPPPSGGPWGPGTGPWTGQDRRQGRDFGGGNGDGTGHNGNGGGGWWGGGRRPTPPRQSSGARGLIWTAVILVVVVLLLRTHRLTTGEIIVFCILIPSVILHEVSHGVVALAFGDDTAKRAGRLSLNPLRHVDLLGTIIVPAITVLSGVGFFGWAKPVPVNVQRLRSPRNQGVLVSLAGPFTNLVLAAAAGLAFHYAFVAGRIFPAVTSTLARVVFDIGFINLWVACFNLIPIPPLDGSAVLERLLPASWWPGYLRVRPYGLFVIFGGLFLLDMAHVYPLGAIVQHLDVWWGHLLGV